MNRQRQNTDSELHIIEIAELTHQRTNENDNDVYLGCNHLLYKYVYNRYHWNFLMGSTFLMVRLLYIFFLNAKLTIDEWYTDTLFFILVNNYLYKRIHWNNNCDSYFNTYYKGSVLVFFNIILTAFSIFNYNSNTFYITKHSVGSFDITNSLLFGLILCYVLINQIYTCIFLYRIKKILLYKQMVKYCILILYFFIDKLLLKIGIFNTLNINEYHIHHWFFGLILLILTDIPQPGYTFLQYINYSVYLHGVAVYGYDSILR